MTDAAIIATFGVAISLLSLSVSATTMYFAWLRRGRLAMTKPTIVFFGYDLVPKPTPKIFLRALLYTTSARGTVIESMHAKLCRGSAEQVFGFWGYGETDKLSPGSGLFVPQTGTAMNHHFVLSVHHPGYQFMPGAYTIRVFARLVGKSVPVELSSLDLTLSETLATALAGRGGVLFEWMSESQAYVGHVQERR